MIIHNIEQGTPEWHKVRCGKFSASKASILFMGKSTKGYNDYINQLVCERLTGEQPESYSNEYMDRGTELEPEAITAYEMLTFNKVDRVGFVEMADNIGCSPDGLIGQDGLVQIKCPKWSTVMDFLLDSKVEKNYFTQMQFEMWVTGRKWNDYFVYHPKLETKPIRLSWMDSYATDFKREIEHAEKLIAERIKQIKG